MVVLYILGANSELILASLSTALEGLSADAIISLMGCATRFSSRTLALPLNLVKSNFAFILNVLGNLLSLNCLDIKLFRMLNN